MSSLTDTPCHLGLFKVHVNLLRWITYLVLEDCNIFLQRSSLVLYMCLSVLKQLANSARYILPTAVSHERTDRSSTIDAVLMSYVSNYSKFWVPAVGTLYINVYMSGLHIASTKLDRFFLSWFHVLPISNQVVVLALYIVS